MNDCSQYAPYLFHFESIRDNEEAYSVIFKFRLYVLILHCTLDKVQTQGIRQTASLEPQI